MNLSKEIVKELEVIKPMIKRKLQCQSSERYSPVIRSIIYENIILLEYFKDLKPVQIEFIFKNNLDFEEDRSKVIARNMRSVFIKNKKKIEMKVSELKSRKEFENNFFE